jgi:predicted GIY-YIG superfamily endonuclease
MAFTYILRTAKESYYVGSTDDLTQRLRQHRAGQVRSTKNKLPVTLVYAERFNGRGEAQKKGIPDQKMEK